MCYPVFEFKKARPRRGKEEKLTKLYNKLVRDKIPEIIEKAGEEPQTRILGKRKFVWEIKEKIREEAVELLVAKRKKQAINEIVDVQELIDTLIAEMGITKFELWELQRKKNEKRGGFRKRLFLIKTKAMSRSV